jgi:hypothetical protein
MSLLETRRDHRGVGIRDEALGLLNVNRLARPSRSPPKAETALEIAQRPPSPIRTLEQVGRDRDRMLLRGSSEHEKHARRCVTDAPERIVEHIAEDRDRFVTLDPSERDDRSASNPPDRLLQRQPAKRVNAFVHAKRRERTAGRQTNRRMRVVERIDERMRARARSSQLAPAARTVASSSPRSSSRTA